jgi:hypothetical protein
VIVPWKTPVHPAFWPWARWKISGGRGPRPVAVQVYLDHHRKLPADWYLHLEWIRRKPRPRAPAPKILSLGVAGTGNGVLMVHPGGDAELAPELLAARFTYVLFNVLDHPVDAWLNARMQASSRGLTYGPWGRLDPELRGDGHARCKMLEDVADEWNSPVVGHNTEKEAESTFTPDEHAAGLAGRRDRTRVVPTEGWVPNGVDYRPLGDIPGVVGAPETFLNVRSDLHPKVCVDHAIAGGFRAALPMFGVGPMAEGPTPVPPAVYFDQWPGLFLAFPGNSIRAADWRRP